MASGNNIAVGIDLGTTFSAASVLDSGASPTPIKFPNEGRQLESAVFVDAEKNVLVGRKARLAAFKQPEALYVQFKRRIPVSPDDPVCAGGPTPIELSAYVLRHVLNTVIQNVPQIEQAIADETCTIVVTHPASYRTVDQQALQRAADLVGNGFRIDQFFSEPVAGAFFFRRKHGDKLREGDLIAVIDIGGGTTDNTILQYRNGKCDEQIADRGDGRLGAINFTGPVFQYFCHELGYSPLANCFDPDSGLNLTNPALSDSDRRLAISLWDKCDRIKIGLSSDETVEEFLESSQGLLELVLSRDQFLQLTEESYRRFDEAVRNTINGTSYSWTDIHHVVLIGGSAMLLGLRERVANLTGRQMSEVYVDTESENVVCNGASYLAYSGEETTQVVAGGCGVRVYRNRMVNGDAKAEPLYKMFFAPGHRISASGETVESLGQFVEAPGGDCTIELALCEAKPGVQVPPASNGTLPLLKSGQVVPIHTVRRTCQLPRGRHEVLLGFDYQGRKLKYRMGFRDQPDLEVLAGTVTDSEEGREEVTASALHDVAILLDCSTSMRGDNLTQAKQAVHTLLDAVDDGDTRAALVSFGNPTHVACSMSCDFDPIRTAVDNLVAKGSTPMAEALRLGTQELTGSDGDRSPILVLVSDGQPNSVSETKSAVGAAKDAGIRVVTVGVGSSVAEDLLQYHLASTTGDYFFASSAYELVGIFKSIADLYLNENEQETTA